MDSAKKLKKVVFLLLVFTVPSLVNAKVINGQEMELVASDTSYIKTTNINGVSLHEIITEEEYNNVDEVNNSLITPFNYAETNYKRLEISVWDSGDNIYLGELELTWKVIPATRSFDVIAFRGQGMRVIENSEMGAQYYWVNDVRHVISYAYNGTNIQKRDLGYGISMNLVNGSDVNGFVLYTSCIFEKTASGTAYVYGAYQHATENVTLAQSQNYDIHAAGLGNTIYFYDGLDAKYDNMPGVYVTIN